MNHNPSGRQTWTAAEDAILRAGWLEKNLSASDISDELAAAGYSKTRCAVLGRVSRLKIPKCTQEMIAQRLARAGVGNRNSRRGRRPLATIKINRAHFVRELRVTLPPDRALHKTYGEPASLIEVTGCRWPINEVAHRTQADQYLFCNAKPACDALPYCPAHCRIAYYAP